MEYKITSISRESFKVGSNIHEWLADMSAEGWDLVQIIPSTTFYFIGQTKYQVFQSSSDEDTFVFKRERTGES